MPTNVQNQQVLRAAQGFVVARATSTVAQSLTSMFLITGGRIKVQQMYAKLTIASDASNATAIVIGFTATEGAGANISNAIAASTVVGVVREIGTHWVLSGAVPMAFSTLQIGTTAASPLAAHMPFILGPGTITYTGSVGTNPASAAWYLHYLPLDSGVNVVSQ